MREFDTVEDDNQLVDVVGIFQSFHVVWGLPEAVMAGEPLPGRVVVVERLDSEVRVLVVEADVEAPATKFECPEVDVLVEDVVVTAFLMGFLPAGIAQSSHMIAPGSSVESPSPAVTPLDADEVCRAKAGESTVSKPNHTVAERTEERILRECPTNGIRKTSDS